MSTQIAVSEKFELYVPDLDNHILVENHGGGVVIHASRDNFSERRKSSFIRHLATEGYIPDRYEWFCEPQADDFFSVRWVVDVSWSENDPEIERRALRREWTVILLGFAVFVVMRWGASPHAF